MNKPTNGKEVPMTGTNTSKLTIASAVAAYVSAAVFATMVAIMASLLLPDVSYIPVIAAGFIAAAFFVLAGILQFKKPYSFRTLAGSAIALLVIAAHISFSDAVTSIFATANLGWSSLVAIIPAVALAYICYPVTAVLSIIVFVQSARSIFTDRTRRPLSPQSYEVAPPQGNNRIAAAVLIAVFATLMVVFAVNFAISSMKSAEQAAELQELLLESTSKFQTQSDDLFEKTSFPERGFELENYFDVSENDVSGGYEFFYRSKKTGMSWYVYEEDDGKIIASMSCVFNERSPLYGQVEDFVLVEEGGDYHMAFVYAGHGASTLHPDEIAAVVETIDKSTLDSYDERRVLDIVQGRERYKEIPEKDRS